MRKIALAILVALAPVVARAISMIGTPAVGSASPNGTFSLTLPSGGQEGDLIICAFAVGDVTGTDNNIAVTGYTEVSDLFIGTDTQDTELWVGYRYFVAGDTACPTSGTFTALGGTNAANAGVAMIFRGVASAAQGGPFDVTSTTATGIDSSNADPPSINHNAPTGIWIVIVGATGHTGGATAAFAGPTNYTTNFTYRAHDDTNDVLIGMGYRSTTPSDPEDPGAMSATQIGTGTNNSWAATTMALKPVTNSTYNESISEAVTLTDSMSGSKRINATVSEAITPTDTMAGSKRINATVSEAITPTDTMSGVATFNSSVSEPVTLTDTMLDELIPGGPRTFNESITEAITVADSLANAVAYADSVSEPIIPGDSMSGTLTLSFSITEPISTGSGGTQFKVWTGTEWK